MALWVCVARKLVYQLPRSNRTFFPFPSLWDHTQDTSPYSPMIKRAITDKTKEKSRLEARSYVPSDFLYGADSLSLQKPELEMGP